MWTEHSEVMYRCQMLINYCMQMIQHTDFDTNLFGFIHLNGANNYI